MDDSPGPRVLKLAKPELDRVCPRRMGQLIHEGLDGEHVAVGAEATV
ncbi:hypothetical protein ACN28E_04570 [Archangium lansingense]